MPDHSNGVLKTTLGNGLTVLIKEMHHAPVATFWLWYRVGSRNEVPGVTGISHWVEHMMFKGTPEFPKGTLDRIIAREGGRFNAFTWIDFTAYFHTLPAEKFDLALRVEADRMQHANFDADEVAAERTVIISERQGHENEPMFKLSEEVQAAAFRVHPYHHEVIGDLADLQTMTREQLFGHYRTFYTPSNAIAVAVGDFNHDQILDRLGELFGPIAAGPALPAVQREEPPQRGERRVVVEGDGQTHYLEMAYRAPDATSADFFPLAVLDTILGGASSFTLSGGGASNRSSRLYRALVATGIAAGVSASLMPTVDPFLYTVSAVALTGRALAEVEAAIQAEIDRLLAEPVSADELRKAIKQTKAQFAYSTESVSDQGFWYGFSELIASHEWFDRYLQNLEAVTAEDVQRVARAVLAPGNRVVGWYVARDSVPAGAAASVGVPGKPARKAAARKTPACKPPARKAPARKVPARKPPARKVPARKPPARKPPARKPPARKPAGRAPRAKRQGTKRQGTKRQGTKRQGAR
jgi:zinc protease